MKVKYSRRRKKCIPQENLRVHTPSDYGWKILDSMFEDLNHLLTDNEKTKFATIIRNRDYDSYLALSEELGPQSMALRGKTTAEVRAVYQLVSLLKKFRFPSDNETRKQKAIQKFLEAEATCKRYNQTDYVQLVWTEDERMRNAYTYARNFLEKLLGFSPPSRDVLTHWSRHGPGANLDTKEGNTSQYFKYSEWPYSCTKGALQEARFAIKDDERWYGALEDSYRERYDIPKYELLNLETFWNTVLHVVPGNRIAFVPKNSQTDRSIAIEPSMNLYLQLGVDGYIRRRLKRWGVDLDSQEKNRELARLGSLNWESPENFVTLDLAAASDSISLEVCKSLLPKCWYNYLVALRSPVGELEGETISYEKVSSMGNGFTFALESAIFTSVVYGVSKEFGEGFNRDDCAVYGDDLIVKNTIAPHVVAMLNLCGFAVNTEKSFFEGPFRESCGADWFKGVAVRPVFCTLRPTTVMELFTDLNRLRRILSLRFMDEESKTESVLLRWIPDKFKNLTGPVSDEDFDSYRHDSNALLSGSYENCLWKYKRLVATPKPVRGESFLFRKLMHNLRDRPIPLPGYLVNKGKTYQGLKVQQPGSRFTVTKSFMVTVSYTDSVADIWRSEYAET